MPSFIEELGKLAFKLQGHDHVQGLDIAIENRKGSVRKGVDRDGKPWRTVMKHPYGYLKGTKGKDGEEIDVYVGPHKDAPIAHVVHQHKADGTGHDEDKVMLGFKNKAHARSAYLAHYNDPKFLGPISSLTVDEMKQRFAGGKKIEKLAVLKTAEEKKLRDHLGDYARHSALNLGQATRDVRYFLDHPDADKVAPKGTLAHAVSSAVTRTPSLASNLYYAALPPQLHHSAEELADLKEESPSIKRIFLEGYKPWEYPIKKASAIKPMDQRLGDGPEPDHTGRAGRVARNSTGGPAAPPMPEQAERFYLSNPQLLAPAAGTTDSRIP